MVAGNNRNTRINRRNDISENERHALINRTNEIKRADSISPR